ncbi:GFA family protein [Beggiatoa alba]
MQGKCLCGSVQFEISTTHLKAYQCHCIVNGSQKECRK